MTEQKILAEIMAGQLEWLKNCQVNGADSRARGVICLDPGKSRAVPYFSNFAALALLEDPAAYPLVERYLDWYLINLEENGTVLDYYFDEDLSFRKTRPDSEDAYAATFLSLVSRYHEKTGRTSWVAGNLKKLKKVARVITRLQCRDGLTFARADHRVKYLMDNCEAWRGLVDFAGLLERLGDPEMIFFRTKARKIADGIEKELWNPRRLSYRPRKRYFLKPRANWRVFYPDAACQIFPVLNGLIRPESARGVHLYARLNACHPDWVRRRPPDYPWMLLGYCACLYGDFARARAQVRSAWEAYILPRSEFWYCLEAAFMVMICALLTREKS